MKKILNITVEGAGILILISLLTSASGLHGFIGMLKTLKGVLQNEKIDII